MSTHIRPATLYDVPALALLCKEIAEYHIALQSFYQLKEDAPSMFAEHLKQLLADEKHYIPVFCKANEILGHAIIKLSGAYPIYNDRITGYIEEFYIVPAMQKQGLGKLLLDEVYNWFKQRNVERISLDVLAANTLGVSFWRRNGFGELHLTMSKDV